MSSEETPKKPRKPRAPRKTAGRVDSVPASASTGQFLDHNAYMNNGGKDADAKVDLTAPQPEIVSSASAPMTEKDDRQTGTEGQDVAVGSSHQPDSFPPPLTDSREQTDSTNGIDADTNVAQVIPQTTAEIVSPASTKTEKKDKDSTTGKDSDAEVIPQATADETAKNMGNDRFSSATDGSLSAVVEPVILVALTREGESRAACWERLRKEARAIGMARGQGPGTAYEWATRETERLFPPVPPPAPAVVDESPVEMSTIVDKSGSGSQMSTIVDNATDIGIPAPVIAPTIPESIEPDVPGLGTIPESWPKLPPNAPLQAEIAWVTANRLVVRSGKGVDLSKALSPAPSYSALSWLETSILFPSKFADISVKATADQDTEKELVKREKMAIEEIRSLLREMLEPK